MPFKKLLKIKFLSLKSIAFGLVLFYAISVTLFSSAATFVATTLSTLGVPSATSQLLLDKMQLDQRNTSLARHLKSSQSKQAKLRAENSNLNKKLDAALDKTKRLDKQLKKLRAKTAETAAAARKARSVQRQVRAASKSIVARSARLLSLNAGATVSEAGVGWIPYAGLAIGASATAWEIKEICGQMDDMDRLAEAVGAEKSDRGNFAYLCGGQEKLIGRYLTKKTEREGVPNAITEIIDNFGPDEINSKALREVDGVVISNLAALDNRWLGLDYTLVGDYIVEHDAITENEWYLIISVAR